MTHTTRWWWIRHAPVSHLVGTCYGNTDVEADCADPAPYVALAAALPSDAVWVTTQLRRTRQTAEAIGAAGYRLPDPILIEPDLQEQNFGAWHGLTHDEIHRTRTGEAHRFWLAPASETPPGGESFGELCRRVGGAVARLSGMHPDRDIVCVAHGGSIRAALGLALGLDPDRSLSFVVDNLSLTCIHHIHRPGGLPIERSAIDGHAWRVVQVNRPPL